MLELRENGFTRGKVMNKFSYYEDTYKVTDIAVIESVRCDDRGSFILLDHTIFYPQGGGQPSDQGQLRLGDINIFVLSAKMIDGEIHHYTDKDYSHIIGQQVNCYLDQEKRLLHSKLHTSGHLISNVLESLYPFYKAIKGHHFPGECYVEFIAKNSDPINIDLELLKREIAAMITQSQQVQSIFVTQEQFSKICSDTSYSIPMNKIQSIRLVKIGNFSYQACGGTHIRATSELQGLEIIKIKAKGISLKVYYSIKE